MIVILIEVRLPVLFLRHIRIYHLYKDRYSSMACSICKNT